MVSQYEPQGNRIFIGERLVISFSKIMSIEYVDNDLVISSLDAICRQYHNFLQKFTNQTIENADGPPDRRLDRTVVNKNTTSSKVVKGDATMSMEAQANEEPIFPKIKQALESEELVSRIEAILSNIENDEELQEYLVDFITGKIEYILSLLEPIEDEIEVAGMLSVNYISIKAEWYMLNTKTQYTRGKDNVSTQKSAYSGSLLTCIIQELENFIDPATRSRVAQMLADPLDIAA